MKVMKDELPTNASWASFGIGRMQMPMAAAAVAMGGNVRVGLEDNLYLEKGVLASNDQLVTRVIEIIQRMGSRVLSPKETRDKLKLKSNKGLFLLLIISKNNFKNESNDR